MSRKHGGRSLRPEEEALWNKVADTTNPLDWVSAKKTPLENLSPAPKPVVPEAPRAPLKSFRLGERASSKSAGHVISPTISEQVAGHALQMDKKSFTRLKRGKLLPEARIDLHGMTLNRAHPILNRFILDAHANGLRLVLVITGKGKERDSGGPIPERVGVLRHQVPQWLQMGALRGAVLQVVEAHKKHGGGGAWYVYLRRRR
ncbi:Smr/MutS family protein [Halocynthiibacter styelae]|uniref:Smr/MutS family protein n=1 Tax=Halocynthiibacter styelae TaxID=2761955 RepID=A0A8J7LL46_9RHOB|nr:Smr/MutS family protein [Paenihalocynthiibacter styelae]MBI1494004.1 Smr/MutS family protein [Paenihalocynthiibacter styelae]